MVEPFYGARTRARNAVPSLARSPVPRTPPGTETAPRGGGDLADILSNGAQVTTIDAMVRAMPDHPAPLSAIMDMVDDGLIAVDLWSGFGASTRVWRTAP